MVGWVSILFAFVVCLFFVFFFPLGGSMFHPISDITLILVKWTYEAPRFPLHLPVSVIPMLNWMLYLPVLWCCCYGCACDNWHFHHFLFTSVHLFLVLSFGFMFCCVPILCLFIISQCCSVPQKMDCRSHDPPEKLHPCLQHQKIIPTLVILLSSLNDSPDHPLCFPVQVPLTEQCSILACFPLTLDISDLQTADFHEVLFLITIQLCLMYKAFHLSSLYKAAHQGL